MHIMSNIENIIFLLLSLDYTSILFILGLSGVLINRRNILLMLLSLELTFLASALNFIISSILLDVYIGMIYGIFVIIVVVADTAIGLSLVVLMYRNSKSVTVSSLVTLRG